MSPDRLGPVWKHTLAGNLPTSPPAYFSMASSTVRKILSTGTTAMYVGGSSVTVRPFPGPPSRTRVPVSSPPTGNAQALRSEPRGAGELYLSILLRYFPLRTFQFAAPRLRHHDQVLLHAFHVRLHLVACAQFLEVPHSLGERPRERLQDLLGLEPHLLCAKAREAQPGGERLPHQLTLHLLQIPLQASVSPLAGPLLQVLIYGGVGVALHLLLVGFPTGRLSCFATPFPRVAAPRHVAVEVGPVHGVFPNGAQVGKHTAKGGYRVYLVQAPHHVHISEHSQYPGSVPPPNESPVVHGVAAARAGGGETLGFLLVSASQRQDVQSESLLRRKPVIKAFQPLLAAHPLLRALSTASSASRRVSSSSVSFILRSSSRSRAWLLIIWLTAVAAPRSTSPERTSAASFFSCALSPAISALALLRPPLEALRRRSAARLGSWL